MNPIPNPRAKQASTLAAVKNNQGTDLPIEALRAAVNEEHDRAPVEVPVRVEAHQLHQRLPFNTTAKAKIWRHIVESHVDREAEEATGEANSRSAAEVNSRLVTQASNQQGLRKIKHMRLRPVQTEQDKVSAPG